MQTILKTWLLHAVILCATQTSGVHIESEPVRNGTLITTELNETLSLLCLHSTASGTDMELVWLRNGAPVNLGANNKGNKSSICVTPVTHEDNGANFTCHLRDNATLKASVVLNVTFAPRENTREDVIVEEQEALVLQCNMYANPAVAVSWQYNGVLLEQTTGKVIVTNDGFMTKLTVAMVDRDLHQGTYMCEVISPIYGTYIGTFKVTVSDRTLKFPLMPMVAGIVVVALTIILAVFSRRKKITKCCK